MAIKDIMEQKEWIAVILSGTSLVLLCVTVTCDSAMVPEVEEGATSASFSVLDPGVYEIIDQTVPGAFMIDVLGNLHLSGHVTMDYESVPEHHVVYRDLDPDAVVSTGTITVYVRDGNDNAPMFLQDVYYGSVTVDNVKEGVVTAVNATDADGRPPNNIIDYYTIADGNTNDAFVVDKDGYVWVNYDMEKVVKETPLYSLTVIAVDRGVPALTGTATVVILTCG